MILCLYFPLPQIPIAFLLNAVLKAEKNEDSYLAASDEYKANKSSLDAKKEAIQQLKSRIDTSTPEQQLAQINQQIAQLDPYYTELSAKNEQLVAANTQLIQAKVKLDAIEEILFQLNDFSGFYLGYSDSGQIRIGSSTASVAFVVQLTNIKKPVMIDGNLPNTEEQCAVEASFAWERGLKTGDTLTRENGNQFKISGIYKSDENSSSSQMIDGVSDAKIDTIIILNDKSYIKNTSAFNLAYYVTANNGFFNLFEKYSPYIESFLANQSTNADKFALLKLDTIKSKLNEYRDAALPQYQSKQKEYYNALEQYNGGKKSWMIPKMFCPRQKAF